MLQEKQSKNDTQIKISSIIASDNSEKILFGFLVATIVFAMLTFKQKTSAAFPSKMKVLNLQHWLAVSVFASGVKGIMGFNSEMESGRFEILRPAGQAS